MTLEQWIVLAASGALFGLIGQLIRTALGFRKLHREAPGNFRNTLNISQLMISLLLGTLAGVMSAIILLNIPGNEDLRSFRSGGMISASFIVSVIAAGYAGGDFLEGIVKSQLKPAS